MLIVLRHITDTVVSSVGFCLTKEGEYYGSESSKFIVSGGE